MQIIICLMIIIKLKKIYMKVFTLLYVIFFEFQNPDTYNTYNNSIFDSRGKTIYKHLYKK